MERIRLSAPDCSGIKNFVFSSECKCTFLDRTDAQFVVILDLELMLNEGMMEI